VSKRTGINIEHDIKERTFFHPGATEGTRLVEALRKAQYESREQLGAEAKKHLPSWLRSYQVINVEDKKSNALDHLNKIMDLVRGGDAEAAPPLLAQLYIDLQPEKDEALAALLNDAGSQIKNLSKRYYLKGEAKDMNEKLRLIKEYVA